MKTNETLKIKTISKNLSKWFNERDNLNYWCSLTNKTAIVISSKGKDFFSVKGEIG